MIGDDDLLKKRQKAPESANERGDPRRAEICSEKREPGTRTDAGCPFDSRFAWADPDGNRDPRPW
jgi:hypothetical protein